MFSCCNIRITLDQIIVDVQSSNYILSYHKETIVDVILRMSVLFYDVFKRHDPNNLIASFTKLCTTYTSTFTIFKNIDKHRDLSGSLETLCEAATFVRQYF